MDELDRHLAALAPTVDTGAARAAFDGRRVQARRRRRVLQGLASVALVAAAAAGVSTLTDEPGEEVVVGNGTNPLAEPTGPVEFEVLAVVPPDADPAVLPRARLIADAEALDLALDGTAPTRQVDFGEEVVVSMAMPHDGCRQLLDLVRGPAGDLRPVFEVPPVVSCSSSSEPAVHRLIVAIRRASLPNAGRLALDEDDPGLPAESLDLPSSLSFHVLGMEPAAEPVGSLRAAADDDQLGELWDGVAFDGAPPTIDFDGDVVVSFTIPDDACPPAVAGFQIDSSTLTPVFADTPGFADSVTYCAQPFIPKTYVVAVDRLSVAPQFTLRLPGDATYGLDEQRLDVVVGDDVDGETGGETAASSVPAADELEFDVLRVGENVDAIGSLRAATDGEGFGTVWPPSGPLGEPPSVDFARQVVVSITIPTSSCAPELTGFQRDGDRIMPTFVEPSDRGCNDILVARTYIVALDRASVEPGFTLFLPGDPTYGFGDTWSVVRLSGADPEPPCRDVEAFAERVDIGVSYDYEASESPAELLAANDVAFRGVLTGGFASTSSSGNQAGEFVAYEVLVTEWLHAGPERDLMPDRQFASIRYPPGSVSAADLAAAAGAAAGTPVVVVAALHDPAPGQLVASIEGFVTACEEGPLLGSVGTQGEWGELHTLDDLAAALRP